MPHINDMKDSKFLKQADCDPPILVTIKGVHEENIAKEGAPPEMKWCLELVEQEKPLVLNSTNAQIIAGVTGSEDTDDWAGHKIVLYRDPNVSYAGKLVGGIRARMPRNQPAKQQPAQGKFATQQQPQKPAAQPPRRPAPPPQQDGPPEYDQGDAYEGDQNTDY